MMFTILDLEWNGAYSARRECYINEIIQIGAVKTNERFEILGTLNCFVHPQIGKKLNDKVEELTSISMEDLEGGIPFSQAFRLLQDFIGDSILLTWGTCDIRTLVENYNYFFGGTYPRLQKQYVDLQLYCQLCLKQPLQQQIGLSAAADLLHIDYESLGLHQALDDSLLSLACLKALYREEEFLPMIQVCNKEFYDRATFKNKILTDLNHPLIAGKKVYFLCPECGERMKQMEKWTLKSKQFAAAFSCGNCGNGKKYMGRVQYKLKYDGLQIKKHLLPLETAQEDKKGRTEQ